MSGWRKNKAKQWNLKKSHVWYWYRKLCSNCWSLHLFGIEMIMEGIPWKSVKFFLGTNQFYLSVNIKLSGEEKTKQISEIWKNQTCAVLIQWNYVVTVGHYICSLLKWDWRACPESLFKFFLGTNQSHLRIQCGGKHIALTSLRVLSMEIVLPPSRIRISICYNFVTCICMPLKLRVMSVFHINFLVKIRFPREVIIWDF